MGCVQAFSVYSAAWHAHATAQATVTHPNTLCQCGSLFGAHQVHLVQQYDISERHLFNSLILPVAERWLIQLRLQVA
jgi:hypothetical protein